MKTTHLILKYKFIHRLDPKCESLMFRSQNRNFFRKNQRQNGNLTMPCTDNHPVTSSTQLIHSYFEWYMLNTKQVWLNDSKTINSDKVKVMTTRQYYVRCSVLWEKEINELVSTSREIFHKTSNLTDELRKKYLFWLIFQIFLFISVFYRLKTL